MIFGEKSIEARVTGDSLVATFHKANPPMVWKFDLERNHSFTLALQGEEGDWELGLTSPKGDFYPITHFLTREDADEAFRAVDKALMKRKASVVWLTGKVILSFALVGLFAFLVSFLLPIFSKIHASNMPPDMRGMTPQQMQQLEQSMTVRQLPAGMAVPADDLKPPATLAPLIGSPPPAPAPSEAPIGMPVPADQMFKAPH